MPTQSQQKRILQKILNSEEFSGSKIYKKYLTYLVDAANQGKELKETTIAIDIFCKDANFNPAEDAIVRTHTYKLRNKLERYYYRTGKDDEYRLNILKGHYEAKFIKPDNDATRMNSLLTKNIHHLQIPLTLILCSLVIFLCIYVFHIKNQLSEYQAINENNPIWKEYLKSHLPVLIIIGNHFVFNEYNEQYNVVIGVRHYRVNSPADFEEFQKQFPNPRRQVSDEPYFPYHSIWGIPPILSIFNSVRQEPILKISSSISPQSMDEYNIIYVGSMKTLYNLEHTLSKSNFQFDIIPQRIIHINPESDTSQVFMTVPHSTGQSEDLVMVVKLPGPVNNSIFIIASYHSLGVPEISNYLTSSKSLLELEQLFIDKYNYVPQYFELLFRVKGIDKTAFNTELLIMNEIP